MGVVHIHGVEAALAWEWGTSIVRGSSREVRGGARLGVMHIQRMEAAFVQAWCTFWV